MKKYFVLLLIVFSLAGFSQNKSVFENRGIFDSVYFDYDSVSTNSFSLLVSMYSPVPVNSMDFSIKMDIGNIGYDTLHILTSNIDGTAFYNEADSTVRFTSFSLQNYQPNTPLVQLNFSYYAPVTNQDFVVIKSYLNGETANPLLRFQTTGISEYQGVNNLPVFPNPCISTFSFDSENSGVMSILNENGSLCRDNIPVNKGMNTVSISDLTDGVYFVVLQTAGQRHVCKLLKNKNIN